jgi:NitT/TauT family transport system substrate-binding protein
MGLNRNRLAALAFMFVSLGATAWPARAANLTKLRVSSLASIDSAAMEAARAQGFFAAEGLELDTTPMVGGAAALPALAAGQVDVAFSNIVSIVLGAHQGLDFTIVAAGDATRDDPPDLAGLVALPGTTLKSGKDLEGKRIAVNTRNNIIWLYARAWIKRTGGDPDKVTYREVPFPQMTDAVTSGQVDAAFSVEPFLSAALASGSTRLLGWPYNAVQKRIPISMVVMLKSYTAAHPDIAERFARAYNKGADWVEANLKQPAFFDLVASYSGLSADKVKAMAPPAFPKTVDPAGVNGVADLMRDNGMFTGPFDARDILYKTVLAAP